MTTITSQPTTVSARPSTDRVNSLGLYTAGIALALGILGDLLLIVLPWGINVSLWVLALAILVFVVARAGKLALTGGGRWLVAPMLLFAALVAGRDSATLTVCNVLALLIVLSLGAARTRTGRLQLAGLLDYAAALFFAGMYGLFGAVALIGAIPWRKLSMPHWSQQARAVGCGLLLALPLLFIFGSLFAAADPIFQSFAAGLFNWNGQDLFGHLIWIVLWSWLAGGFLYLLLLANEFAVELHVQPGVMSLGIVEIGTALGLVNVLFLAFVVIQFRYFFGGAAILNVATGLTYAEYARRGFFELVTVAALVLPVLLIAHWLLKKDGQRAERSFNILAAVLIALLFVIMISALQRMRLYTEEFGLTELRLYTTAFMGWLALVFVWLLATVLRGQRERFAFGALVAGLGVLVILNAVNPDDMIARTNTGRIDAATRQPFDAGYVTGLSADAVPTLIQTLPQLGAHDRCLISQQILKKWSSPANVDWRTWNWSRFYAWQWVRTNSAYLTGACTN